MKNSDMMQKCPYIQFEAWILNGEITKQLAPIEKQAILLQVLIRDKEIAELQDKLHRRNVLCNARAKEIKELKKRIEELQEGSDICSHGISQHYCIQCNPKMYNR